MARQRFPQCDSVRGVEAHDRKGSGSELTRELLERVARQLSATATTTDGLLLARWRTLALCQHLLGSGPGEADDAVRGALECVAQDGFSREVRELVAGARRRIVGSATSVSRSIMPVVSEARQDDVLLHLGRYESRGPVAISQASSGLGELRTRLRRERPSTELYGVLHRLELVAEAVRDDKRSQSERLRAAAAILYLEEVQDAVDDTLGTIGLLDDDFALRLVLQELGRSSVLHWSEEISVLWEDLPFLRRVNLSREGKEITVSWLDRLNAYFCYEHALGRVRQPLLLLQPCTSCSFLQPLVALMGLLVLDGLTVEDKVRGALERDRVYKIDGRFFAKLEGWDEHGPGGQMLRLRFRDASQILPAARIMHRMAVAAPGERRLSKLMDAYEHLRGQADPVQRFFGWEDAIGAARVPGKVVVVSSRARAYEALSGVRSNGVDLLGDGLVRFLGEESDESEAGHGLVVVVPRLGVVRDLVGAGVAVSAVMVDGYEALRRDRYDIPFLGLGQSPPALVGWATAGYVPFSLDSSLSDWRVIGYPRDALVATLELDGDVEVPRSRHRRSLWECATGGDVHPELVRRSEEEREALLRVGEYLTAVREHATLPEFLRFRMAAAVWRLYQMISATPALWEDVWAFSEEIRTASAVGFDSLRRTVRAGLEDLCKLESAVMKAIQAVDSEANSKGERFTTLLASVGVERPLLVCNGGEQVRVAERLGMRMGHPNVKATLIADVPGCSQCVVGGWHGWAFARKLWAHAPSGAMALVDELEREKWRRACRSSTHVRGESALAAMGESGTVLHRPSQAQPVRPSEEVVEEQSSEQKLAAGGTRRLDDLEDRVEAVVTWLADTSECRVLQRSGRVFVESRGRIGEKRADELLPFDRVLLGSGVHRWAPAEEFTEAVVEEVKATHAGVVELAREWRLALARFREAAGLTVAEVRSRLTVVGVSREQATIEGWLRMDRSAPIGPRSLERELGAIWRLVGTSARRSEAEVVAACRRMRSVRRVAGKALLRLLAEETPDLDLQMDAAWLDGLVSRLKRSIQAHEVVEVRRVTVPRSAVGCWLTPEMARALP